MVDASNGQALGPTTTGRPETEGVAGMSSPWGRNEPKSWVHIPYTTIVPIKVYEPYHIPYTTAIPIKVYEP